MSGGISDRTGTDFHHAGVGLLTGSGLALLGAPFAFILGLLLAPPLAVVALILVRMLYLRDTLDQPVDLS